MKSAKKLTELLAEVCAQSERGEKVTAIHLFGIRHADSLRQFTLKEMRAIAKEAGQSESYGTELHKMMRLAKFVVEKK